MSRERGTKTEQQAMRAAEPAEATALFPFPTLVTPRSGVRIPASPPHPPANLVDDEVTVFDFGALSDAAAAAERAHGEGVPASERTTPNETTRLGLFVVAREPKTEPHLPVADPFEVAEQLSGISAAEESRRHWEARDARASASSEAGPPSDATLCSVGVERPSHTSRSPEVDIDIPAPVMPRVILVREERRLVAPPPAVQAIRPRPRSIFERLATLVLVFFRRQT